MLQKSGKNKILSGVAIFIIILLSIIVMAFIYHEFIQRKKVDNFSKSIPVETKDVAANSQKSTSNATISETQQTKSIPLETKDVAANSQELTSNVPVPKTQSVKEKVEQSKPTEELANNSNKPDESTARIVQVLNLATVSIKKIINTEDRIVLDQEYNNIINNLKFETIKSERELIDLYKELMNVITQLKLNNEEKSRFLQAFEKNKKKATWKAAGGIRAYGGDPVSFLFSLAQSSVSAYFNYNDMKSEMQSELDESLWQIKKYDAENINKLWTEWLPACWKISDNYKFESKGYFIVREQYINDYLEAEAATDLEKAMRGFERLEEYSVFLHSYPPFWLSYAMKAEKAGDMKKRDECLNKYFETYREILDKDPVFGRACLMKARLIWEKRPDINNQEVKRELEELLAKADKHLDITDGEGRIFISALYQRLGYIEKAKKTIYVNIDNKVDTELSNQVLENIERGKDAAENLPQVLALLVQEELPEENISISIEELLKLAQDGNTLAMLKLGESYQYGKGIPKDLDKAKEWYEKAAEKGNVDAMVNLGALYYEQRDKTKTIEWYEKAAEKGNDWAMFSLGVLYSKQRDYAKAIEWSEKAVEKGNGMAILFLGELYSEQGDYAKAIEWYEKLAEKGSGWAMVCLGELYYEQGDKTKAIEWFEKAAEKGNDLAMCVLGALYYEQRDKTKAIEWFEKAAKKGNTDAMNNLGLLYKNQGDYAKAKEWYEKAAEKGYDWAMVDLGDLYANGYGVEKDYVLAYAYYTLAMERGDDEVKEKAKKGRDGLKGWFLGITEEQIKEAEELVRSYRKGELLRRNK